MPGVRRRGFAGKKVAKVLRLTQAATRAIFWREIKYSRSKKSKSTPAAVVIQEQGDLDDLKRGKRRASR